MTKSDKVLKTIGLLALGAFGKAVFTNFIQPLALMRLQEVENEYSINTAKMQLEMNDIVGQGEEVNSNVIGFQTDEYEEEYDE